jgi:hypothetical protein
VSEKYTLTIAYCQLTKPYSYGDSAGFTPDFPFNGALAPTKYSAKMIMENGNTKKENPKPLNREPRRHSDTEEVTEECMICILSDKN